MKRQATEELKREDERIASTDGNDAATVEKKTTTTTRKRHRQLSVEPTDSAWPMAAILKAMLPADYKHGQPNDDVPLPRSPLQLLCVDQSDASGTTLLAYWPRDVAVAERFLKAVGESKAYAVIPALVSLACGRLTDDDNNDAKDDNSDSDSEAEAAEKKRDAWNCLTTHIGVNSIEELGLLLVVEPRWHSEIVGCCGRNWPIVCEYELQPVHTTFCFCDDLLDDLV